MSHKLPSTAQEPVLGSLRCFRAPATVRCFRAPVTKRYFRVPGSRLWREKKTETVTETERERERSLCEQVMWNGSIYIGTPCAVMYIGAHCSLHTAQLVQVLDSRASQCSQWLPGSKLTVQKRRPAKSRLKAQSRKLAQNVLAGQEQPRQKVYPDGE